MELLNSLWQYIDSNKEWIFSGVGVAIITTIVTIIIKISKRKKKNELPVMTQKSGDNSTNIQIGGSYYDGKK